MSEADPIRVLVVDDQDLVRGGFKAILGTYEGIEIVGEARNGADAVQEAQRLRPDVVLMDIRMPEMNGIEATAPLRATRCSRRRGCSCSPPSTWTSTFTMLWAPGRAAFF